jgi:DNA-directed DNA polymerase III PolC
MFVHLHTRSWFSFLAGSSAPEDLAQQAHELGQTALALTDLHGVYGAVRFQKACRRLGLRPLIGAEVVIDHHPLVLLARTPQGFFHLNQVITAAHLQAGDAPAIPLTQLTDRTADLICLTGGRQGQLWQLLARSRRHEASVWLQQLQHLGFAAVFVELVNGLLPADTWVMHAAADLARQHSLPTVATNDVRYARQEDYVRYDLLTCIRRHRQVAEADPERPCNAEEYLKSEAQMAALIPYPEALTATATLAMTCEVDLLPGQLIAPAARIPTGQTAQVWLASSCLEALRRQYTPAMLLVATAQLNKELGVICRLGLEEFFLVVREIVTESRRRGIRCAGRGSAANSIVAYLLGITQVDPIRHRLLFERFLHGGRKGTPDVDVDFDSERREEIITWMEQRFGIEQTAMTATVVSFRLHSALRDVGKALGWPLSQIDHAIASLPLTRASQVRQFRPLLQRELGDTPLLDLYINLVEGLEGCPRHLGLHVGGMVLCRTHLNHFSPIQVSANGVKMVQFDKDDVEAIGLIKFDVLGLRMLATLSEATELMAGMGQPLPELSSLPLDDEAVYRFIRSGRTIAVFQIESQGQIHLLSAHQPQCFDDLITEIALFRPGPLQGGMVHPFIRRRQGVEPVTYDHADLAPILTDTYGIILFQEQILEIAHQFAGMPLAEADDFRALMSKFRDPGQMESMRVRFVSGAVSRGVDTATAQKVFDQVANFVGYGFCRSHAAAFAQTVYYSAWLKHRFPAAFMAAVMQHRPGMYSQLTLEQEARRCGVDVLGPHINASDARFALERQADGRLAIRKPFAAIHGISAELSRRIVWCRLNGPFRSIEELLQRVELPPRILLSLAESGALDPLAGSRRQAFWEIGLWQRRQQQTAPAAQLRLFDAAHCPETELPVFPDLSLLEKVRWDWRTQGAPRLHPLALVRRHLNDLRVTPIGSLAAGPPAAIAGLVIMRQKPPTAKGMMFLTIEDETGFVQCLVVPAQQERFGAVLFQPFLIIRGKVQGQRHWRCVILDQVWVLERLRPARSPDPSLEAAAYAEASTDRPAAEAMGLG